MHIKFLEINQQKSKYGKYEHWLFTDIKELSIFYCIMALVYIFKESSLLDKQTEILTDQIMTIICFKIIRIGGWG